MTGEESNVILQLQTNSKGYPVYCWTINETSVYPAGPTPLGTFGAYVLAPSAFAPPRLRRLVSVWNGPASNATGHASRPASDWLVRSVQACAQGHYAVQRSWPLWTFSKWAILHRFPNFYTLRVHMFFPFTSAYDPYKRWKVLWKSVRTFLRNPEQIHTHRRGNFIYIEAKSQR